MINEVPRGTPSSLALGIIDDIDDIDDEGVASRTSDGGRVREAERQRSDAFACESSPIDQRRCHGIGLGARSDLAPLALSE